MADFADVDSLVASYHQRGGPPGLAYGVVVDGELVHAAGLGERALGRPVPDAATVFRIASMTKSFTASAVLALRDDGALRLDDPAGRYVPELADWPPVSPDAAPISIRHLLTMTAGFPTDDPWGDRQQGLPLDDFAAFLARGVRFNWAPGTRFEYSNLGFAILGRVITAVTGAAYPDYIRDRLLRPLGMTRTGFEAAEFDLAADRGQPPGGLARGYRRAPGGWSEVPFEACGAFAPMGGIFSCVQDLSRWVAGFAAAFPPGGSQDAGSQDGGSHPVRRATRREMQLSQVATGWDGAPAFPGYEAAGPPGAYGFGLFVTEHPALGRIVSHSGGYPGFGSNMCWHLASRTGVVALGNSTYAPMSPLTVRLLGTVLRRAKPPSHGYAVALSQEESGPWPETLAARDTVDQLLRSWDDATAERLFSPNVAADAPFAERQRLIALVRERTGDFLSSGRPPEFDTPAHCRWWLAGDRGVVQVQIQLTPERPPRVQSLTLAVPPAAGSPLGDTLDAVLSWLNGTDRDWPAAIPVVSTVDASHLARRLRMAAVWAGPCRVAAYRAGDGSASVAVELDGQHGGLVLALVIDPGTRLLQLADVAPEPRS